MVSIPLTAITGSEVQTAEEVGVAHIREADTPVLVVGLETVQVKEAEDPLEGRWCSAGRSEGPAAVT